MQGPRSGLEPKLAGLFAGRTCQRLPQAMSFEALWA